MKRLRRILILLLTTAAIVVLLVWSFRDVKMAGMVEAFRNARWGFAPLAICMGLFVFPLKALRWRLLIAPLKPVRFRTLLSAIMIGFMVNCIFSRVGELARALVVGLKGEARSATALATIALERVFDVCTVVLFLVLSLIALRPAAYGEGAAHLAKIRTAGAVGVVVFIAAVVFLVLLKVRSKATKRIVLRCVAWLPKQLKAYVEGFLESFLNGLNAIQSARQVAAIFLLSVLHWFFQVLYFLFMAYCFPGLEMTLAGAMLVFAITALGVAAVPLPGYLGVFQASVMAAAAIMTLPHAESVSYAWLSWALNVPPIILIGFGFLWMEGLSLGELRAGAKRTA